jgi:hypothetical protein
MDYLGRPDTVIATTGWPGQAPVSAHEAIIAPRAAVVAPPLKTPVSCPAPSNDKNRGVDWPRRPVAPRAHTIQ